MNPSTNSKLFLVLVVGIVAMLCGSVGASFIRFDAPNLSIGELFQGNEDNPLNDLNNSTLNQSNQSQSSNSYSKYTSSPSQQSTSKQASVKQHHPIIIRILNHLNLVVVPQTVILINITLLYMRMIMT